jgi:hypothetical protein
MVHRAYSGLGPPDAAVRAFEGLRPHVEALCQLRAECGEDLRDRYVFDIALEALDTTAYHFTRRQFFFERVRYAHRDTPPTNGRLRDREEAERAMEDLRPYSRALGNLQYQCRPFGRDYLALEIAKNGLDTVAYHFTRIPSFFGLHGDASGSRRPPPDPA